MEAIEPEGRSDRRELGRMRLVARPRAEKHRWKKILKEGGTLPDDIAEDLAATTGESVAAIQEAAARAGVAYEPRRGVRATVVGCRVNVQDLEAIDLLVETGVCATRSEASAWLISAGIEAQHALLGELRATVSEIRRLRERAQEKASKRSTPVAEDSQTDRPRV